MKKFRICRLSKRLSIILVSFPLALFFQACSSPSSSTLPLNKSLELTSADVFPQTSQTWTMVNERGERTFFELSPVHGIGCETGQLLDLHITKDSSSTYWQTGTTNAAIHFIMRQEENGGWRATASLIHWDDPDPSWNFGKDISIDYLPVDGEPSPYMILPATASSINTTTMTGHAQWYLDRNQQLKSCLTNAEKGPLFRWTSKFYIESVNTPVYSGPALVSEQFEGCASEQDETPDSRTCAHEKWYFAKGIGLVQINSVWQQLTIKRVP